jgi:hypothetical protein
MLPTCRRTDDSCRAVRQPSVVRRSSHQTGGWTPGSDREGTGRSGDGGRLGEAGFEAGDAPVLETQVRPGRAAKLVAEHAPYLTVEETLETPFLLLGTAGQIAERLRENRERYGFSYITVHEPYMDDLVLVIERLRTA